MSDFFHQRKIAPLVPGETSVDGIISVIKEGIFDFQLLPGDRFSENDVAQLVNLSRTPVREALFQLQKEGFLEIQKRRGWKVKEMDFQVLEELYDFRILLEIQALHTLCNNPERTHLLERLKILWNAPEKNIAQAGERIARLDEDFHRQIVQSLENNQISQVYENIAERIRIIRRLDFSLPERIEATYEEHKDILLAIEKGTTEKAQGLMREHILKSKAKVYDVTLHRLYEARKMRKQKEDPGF